MMRVCNCSICGLQVAPRSLINKSLIAHLRRVCNNNKSLFVSKYIIYACMYQTHTTSICASHKEAGRIRWHSRTNSPKHSTLLERLPLQTHSSRIQPQPLQLYLSLKLSGVQIEGSDDCKYTVD